MPSDQPLRATIYVRLSEYREGETPRQHVRRPLAGSCAKNGGGSPRGIHPTAARTFQPARECPHQPLRRPSPTLEQANRLKAVGVELASFSDRDIDTTSSTVACFFQPIDILWPNNEPHFW
jgi:hypothetical protein